MSQEKLGEAIGLTFQQVQKYERGSNRISAGTLYRLSQVLDVPVSFFFDCYDDGNSASRAGGTDPSTADHGTGLSRREARLLRLWRLAPRAIADEMLALLASLSADPRTGDGADEDESATDHPRHTTAPAKADGVSTSAGRRGRPRRRHGAVWDPADIVRAAKATGRDE